MTAVAERVDRLELALERFMASAEAINRRADERIARSEENIARLDRQIVQRDEEIRLFKESSRENLERLDRQIAQRDEEIRLFKESGCENLERLDRRIEEDRRETRKHTLDMAKIADRIGRFAEDIVIPNLPRVARESFGIGRIDFAAPRIEKRHMIDLARSREFDFILAGQGKLLVNETKSTARLKYIDDFAAALKEIFDYFPEFRGHTVIPVFASLALSPDFVRCLSRFRIYAMALGDRTMELLNLQDVSGRHSEPRSS